jgi:Bacterial protein of unknown function (HtrL_YibB)
MKQRNALLGSLGVVEHDAYDGSTSVSTSATAVVERYHQPLPQQRQQQQQPLSQQQHNLQRKKRKGRGRWGSLPLVFVYCTVVPVLVGLVYLNYRTNHQAILLSNDEKNPRNNALLAPARNEKKRNLDDPTITGAITTTTKMGLSTTTMMMIHSPSTIVTAYFPTKSKYPQSQYIDWMSTMLSLQDPMIIYTTSDMIPLIYEHRSHAKNRTVIVPMTLDELPLVQQYPTDVWQAEWDKDPEKKRHASYQVFWIWLSKSYFLLDATLRNPFESTYFLWSDIGCFRGKKDAAISYWHDKTIMIHTDLIPHDRMLFLAHHPPNPPPTTVWWTNKLGDKDHFYHSGTFIAGTQTTIPLFHAAFLETLAGFFTRGLFVGDDQTVVQCTCLQNPQLCAYIPSSQVRNDNHYFGLRSVLHFGGSYELWYPPSLKGGEEQKQQHLPPQQEVSSSQVIANRLEQLDPNHRRPLATSLLTQPPPFEDTDIVRLSNEQLITSPNTVVTAYYRIPSKFKPGAYNKWMKNMLSLQDAMVIFTSRDLISTITALRQHAVNRTIIIPLELNALPIGQLYTTEFWQDQLHRDPEERHHQSFELFWIWLSKSWCVSQAIRLNVYHSDLFVWSDIGCFRDTRYNFQTMVQHRNQVPLHEMIQMAHHAPNPPPLPIDATTTTTELYWNDKYHQKDHFYHSGSQMAAYADTWQVFHAVFLDTIDGFLDRNMIIVEDQAVLQSVCLRRPELCAYVPFDQVRPKDNHYFGLRYVLHYGGEYQLWRYHPPTMMAQKK